MKFLILVTLLISSLFATAGSEVTKNHEPAEDIAIPGRPTAVSTLFGTITIKCQGDGKCGYIRLSKRKAFFDLGKGVEEIDFLDYDISTRSSPDGSETVTTVVFETK